eukprot:1182599-Prorocentrum_minimum.AAC.4
MAQRQVAPPGSPPPAGSPPEWRSFWPCPRRPPAGRGTRGSSRAATPAATHSVTIVSHPQASQGLRCDDCVTPADDRDAGVDDRDAGVDDRGTGVDDRGTGVDDRGTDVDDRGTGGDDRGALKAPQGL